MSARKLENSFQPVVVQVRQTRISVATGSLCIRKNGIEFRTNVPIEPWTEMTVQLESPADAKKIECNGIVVACEGNRHACFRVSMVFTGLTRAAQAHLNEMAFSRLA